jgi:hypothetical protein
MLACSNIAPSTFESSCNKPPHAAMEHEGHGIVFACPSTSRQEETAASSMPASRTSRPLTRSVDGFSSSSDKPPTEMLPAGGSSLRRRTSAPSDVSLLGRSTRCFSLRDVFADRDTRTCSAGFAPNRPAMYVLKAVEFRQHVSCAEAYRFQNGTEKCCGVRKSLPMKNEEFP